MTDPEPAYEQLLSDEYRWSLLQNKAQNLRVREAFNVFRRYGIEPVLIKGWAAGRLYPRSKFRPASDIDLAVDPAEYEVALEILGRGGARPLGVDLHRGLRHLDTVRWDDLFDNSVTVDLEGVPIRMLRQEDHLRVLCVHWLTDGGAYKQRLWDIYYAVANRPSDFDWDRCLLTVSETRRRWLILVIGLAHRYLDLNIDGLPFEREAREIPEWLSRAVEHEWASDVRLTQIHHFLRDPGKLIEQIRKRFPPNPIQSTVDMEGSFDARTRVHYQIGSLIKRVGPSLRRIAGTLIRKPGQDV